MTARALTARDRRALLAGTVVVLSLVLGARVWPALRTWTVARRVGDGEEVLRLAQVERSLRDRARTAAALTRARERLAAYDEAVLEGDTPAEAGVALAALVSDAAEVSEAVLGSMQVRADSVGRSALLRASARVTVTGDMESLALFLQRLDEGPQLLAVRELAIGGGDPAGGAARPQQLQLDALIEGLFANPRPQVTP